MYLFELVADDLCGTVTSLRRRRRWRALPCWDPRGGLARAPRAACMSGSGGRSHGCGPPCGRVRQGWRRLGCYQPAGWWRCGLAPSRRGVRWPGRRGSWAVSVVRTTALDPNRGMSVAAGGRVRPVGDHGQAFERRWSGGHDCVWPGRGLLVFLVRAHRARAVAQAPTPVPGSGPGV